MNTFTHSVQTAQHIPHFPDEDLASLWLTVRALLTPPNPVSSELLSAYRRSINAFTSLRTTITNGRTIPTLHDGIRFVISQTRRADRIQCLRVELIRARVPHIVNRRRQLNGACAPVPIDALNASGSSGVLRN